MDYEEATETKVSVGLALSELEEHGVVPYVDAPSASILDNDTGETIAKIVNGEVDGGAVLAWLGY